MTAVRLSLLALALVCAALATYLAVSSRVEAKLERASAHISAGRGAEALTELDSVGGAAAGRAARLRGAAYFAGGRLPLALAAFRDAAGRDPNNWLVQRDYAIVLLRSGDRVRARARMRAARALNPRMALPSGFASAGPG